jgi:hypothetical protein
MEGRWKNGMAGGEGMVLKALGRPGGRSALMPGQPDHKPAREG